MAELMTPVAARAAAREHALHLAMESLGMSLDQTSMSVILKRASEIEEYLWPPLAERPHHACSQPGCTTPSGKTACHTCGEAWPCSAELRERPGT
jgi:hypothetical protein